MDREWHFVHKGESKGPVSGEGLITLAADGLLNQDTLVWSGGEQWQRFGDVTELVEALRQAEAEERADKRRRLDGKPLPPSAEVQQEIPGWAQALDEPSQLALFEKALFTHLEDAIQAQPGLRDQLLTAYITRHPASDDRDPQNYELTDEFLMDAIEDFESQEEMWEVLGHDNAAAVVALISAAARLDQRYCAELQNLALLSRARALVQAGSEGVADALAQLVVQEPAVTLARDHEGRSLWHDLAAGEQVALLRRLLPMVQGPAADGQPTQHAAEGQAAQAQGVAQEQRETQRINPLNLADLKGNTPLHVAAQAGNTEVARLLIDQGAALDIQNRDPSKYAQGSWQVRTRNLDFTVPVPSVHQTALHIAAEAGDVEMLQLLIERGAMLDIRDAAGSTALHLALEAQDEEAASLLLQAGASPNLANSDMAEGSTCVSLVAGMGRPGLLRLVLGSSKLAPSAVNAAEAEQGFTPLMLAARRGNAECVQLLLKAGADTAAVNKQGKTALDIAQVNKRAAVVEALQRHAAAAAGGSEQCNPA